MNTKYNKNTAHIKQKTTKYSKQQQHSLLLPFSAS